MAQKTHPELGALSILRMYSKRQGVQRRSIPGPALQVDQVLELLAGLEVGHLLGRNADAAAGLRVASLSRRTIPDAEAPEAAELDLFALLEGVGDAVQDCLDDDLGVLLGQIGLVGDFF